MCLLKYKGTNHMMKWKTLKYPPNPIHVDIFKHFFIWTMFCNIICSRFLEINFVKSKNILNK